MEDSDGEEDNGLVDNAGPEEEEKQEEEEEAVSSSDSSSSSRGEEFSEYSFDEADFDEGEPNLRKESKLGFSALTNMGRNIFK